MCQKLIAVLKQAPKIIAQLNKTIIHEYPELQEKSIVPNGQVQEVVADDGIYGLSKVTVDAVSLQEKSVTPSAQLQEVVADEGYTGLSKVNVVGDDNLIAENIKKDVEIFGVQGVYQGEANDYNVKVANYAGGDLKKYITEIGEIDLSKATSCSYLFQDLTALEKLPSKLETSHIANMGFMFYNCKQLSNFPELDTSNVTNMSNMFYYCLKAINFPKMDTRNVTDMSSMFCDCDSMKNAPELNTGKATDMQKMYYSCNALESVPELDASNCKSVYNTFYNDRKLLNFGGLKNLGKAYTQKSTNYSYYTLDLSYCTLLTYESLMSVLNGLYDLNLTYDIANGGTLYRQTIKLGSTNKAKLTEEEIAIATFKGWNVT